MSGHYKKAHGARRFLKRPRDLPVPPYRHQQDDRSPGHKAAISENDGQAERILKRAIFMGVLQPPCPRAKPINYPNAVETR